MANKSQMANDIRRVADFFKGMTALADELDALQSVEEAHAAADKRLAELSRRENEAAARVAAADAAVEEATARADGIVKSALEQGNAKLAEAKDAADKLVADGEAKGRARADQIAEQATGKLGKLGKDIDAAQARVDALAAQEASLRASVEDMTAKHADASKKLADIQKRIGKLAEAA